MTESDDYLLTAATIEYPSWVTPYITVDNQTDANSIYYNTFNFTFSNTAYPELIFTLKQTQTLKEKINCHYTNFEYLITVKVGLCIDTCGTYLTVPTIDPSIFDFVLDNASKGEDIALPGFWDYPSNSFATIFEFCGIP